MKLPLITRAQANRYLLRRQHLLEPCQDPVAAVMDACGLQAQVPSTPALSLYARVKGFTRPDYDRLLIGQRRLVRTWAMRGTVHVLPAAQLAMYAGIYEVPETAMSGVKQALELLAEGPLTRGQLVEKAVAELGLPEAKASELFGPWGGALRHAALMGLVVHMPTPGPDVPFVRTRDWLGADPEPVPVERPEDALLQAYAHGYGPITAQDFAHFTSRTVQWARAVCERAQGLAEVQLEGSGLKHYIPEADLPELLAMTGEETAPVQLLPRFDSLVLVHRDKTRYLDEEYRTAVFRPAAVVEAVALVRGRVAGTWRSQTTAKELRFTFFPFARPRQRLPLKQIEAEAWRLARWHGVEQLAFTVGE